MKLTRTHRATMIANFAALVALTPRASSAQQRTERVIVDLQAPKDCPTKADLTKEVERLLADAKTTAEPLEVRIRVHRTETRVFRLVLETDSERGSFRRELEAGSCRELVKPAAVIIALAIDPEAAARGLEADAATAFTEPSEPERPPTGEKLAPRIEQKPETPGFADELRPTPARAPSIVEPGTPASERGYGVATLGSISHPAETPRDHARLSKPRQAGPFKPFLRGGGVADFGALPGPSVGPSVGGGVGWKSLRVQALIFYLPPRRAALDGQPNKGGNIELTAGRMSGCFVPLEDPLEVGGCLGLEAGWVRGEGFGITDPKSGSTGWLATAAGALFGYAPKPELALVLHAEATRRIGGSEFVIEGLGAVHRPSTLGARVDLGVELRFP